MRQLSHNAFSRLAVLRRNVRQAADCAFCGAAPRPAKSGAYLYQYGAWGDAKPFPEWERRAFCSKSCRDTYHS